MRVVDIRLGDARIASPMRNAVISFEEMTCTIVAVLTDAVCDGQPVVGYGFTSNGRYSASAILRDRMAPRVLRADPDQYQDSAGDLLDPASVWQIAMTNEKPGGHGERSVAMGALDMAIWDALAKARGVPLWKHLADRVGRIPDSDVFTYAAGGYYYDQSDPLQPLRAEMTDYLELGYTHTKLKIGVDLADDIRRVEAVVDVVGDPSRVAVDANARLQPAQALEYAKALEPFGLFWYEEPCDPLDYAALAELASVYSGSLATGENLFSMPDTRNLLRYGGLRPDRDVLQIDCALSYGLVEYMRMLDQLRQHDWSWRRVIPHGGHQMSLHIAAGLGLGGNESYPGLFHPFGGFADDAKICDGRVAVDERPGIGLEGKRQLITLLQRELETT
jgi:D(-)-tartrate dehydratase